MSEHQWQDECAVAVGYISGGKLDFQLQQHCSVCGQGRLTQLPDGYNGPRVAGFYATWDGVKTCEDVILERHRDETLAKMEHAARLRRIEAERPRRQAFIDDLNAICAKHSAHLFESEDEGARIELEPRMYELAQDGRSVR